jgi:signal transduction histidine kinase
MTGRQQPDSTFAGFISSSVDVTERKVSEGSLHALMGRLIRAQEEERARIALELHDDFSQRLALLAVSLGQLWKDISESEVEQRKMVLDILKATKEISSDLHSLSHQLHSSKLEQLGLVVALRGLCKEISEKDDVQVRFTESGFPRSLPKHVELSLFRVTQESLRNVAKHSQAKRAHVELRVNADGVSLRVSDEGKGFDINSKGHSMGIGLIGMTERLRLVGGRLLVKSDRRKGTEVLAEVPLMHVAISQQATGGVHHDTHAVTACG